jgi:hypothetical protein
MIVTFAPSRAKTRAISAPKPDAAPVTRADFPFRRMMWRSSYDCGFQARALCAHCAARLWSAANEKEQYYFCLDAIETPYGGAAHSSRR